MKLRYWVARSALGLGVSELLPKQPAPTRAQPKLQNYAKSWPTTPKQTQKESLLHILLVREGAPSFRFCFHLRGGCSDDEHVCVGALGAGKAVHGRVQ